MMGGERGGRSLVNGGKKRGESGEGTDRDPLSWKLSYGTFCSLEENAALRRLNTTQRGGQFYTKGVY